MTTTKAGPNDDVARSEDELFPPGGRPSITLHLGGVTKQIRELSARKNDAWKDRIAVELAGRLKAGASLDNVENLAKVFSGVQEVQLQLLVAYDEEGRLGGADWILDNATASEIWAAFKVVTKAAFPFLEDAARAPNLVAEILPQLVALLGSKPSTSGDAASAS